MKTILSKLGATFLDFSLAALTYLIMLFILNLIAGQIFVSVFILAALSHGLLPPGLLALFAYLPDFILWINILCLAVAIGGYFVILRPVVWWALRVKPVPKMNAALVLSLICASVIVLFLTMIVSIWKS